jgi:hypothetical protein
MAEPLDHRDFELHVGKLFHFPASQVPLRLVQIERHDAFSERMPFTLTFHGPVGDLLPEGFYPAEAEGGAVLEFYVIPVHTPSGDRQDYQAVFN